VYGTDPAEGLKSSRAASPPLDRPGRLRDIARKARKQAHDLLATPAAGLVIPCHSDRDIRERFHVVIA